jgi:hypothetical protein
MTDTEHAALEHILQVVQSVVGGKTAAPPAPFQIDETETTLPAPAILPVPYAAQLGPGADQFSTDSGSAAGAMLVCAYTGRNITPNDFFNQSGQTSDSPLSFAQIANGLTANGVTAELRMPLKLVDLALILSSGRPAILLVKQAVLQQAGLTPETFDGPHYLVAVGLDVKQVYIHDPLRQDASGQGQAVPWLTLYQAWTQAAGCERAALVPRLQLVRRIRVAATSLYIHAEPNVSAAQVGTVNEGDTFEVTAQMEGWGKIGEARWINLSYVVDI